jgi:hypothetical protein
MNKIKILFLAANPVNSTPLQLDEEIRSITQKIQGSEWRDLIELVSAWAVRPDDLLQLLNQHKPQIVHFSGHGMSTGEIILLDNAGAVKPVSATAIRSLFKTLKDNIRLVVLNACFSRLQAKAIVENIDCAVGMSTAIGDQAAILFAASLYRAIGFGRSIEEAFEQGKTALLLEGIPEENTPRLLCRVGVNPASVYILNNPGPNTSNVAFSPSGATIPMGTPVEITKSMSDFQLLDFINEYFNMDEIRHICFNLGEMLLQAKKIPNNTDFDIDTFSSVDNPKRTIVQEMVQYFRRRNWTSFLIAAVKIERPDLFTEKFGE